MEGQERGGGAGPETARPEQGSAPRSSFGWVLFVGTGLSASLIALVRYFRDGTVNTLDGWQPANDHPVALAVTIVLNLAAVAGVLLTVLTAMRSGRAKP